MSDSFGARDSLEVSGREYEIHRLDALQSKFDVARLPYSLKVLLENVLRLEDGESVTADDVETIATWDAKAEPSKEIPFQPARVLMQDFTGVPAVVDLAAMRDAMADMGGDASKINPLVPAELYARLRQLDWKTAAFGSEDLDASVFEAEVKPHLVHETVRAELNAREVDTNADKDWAQLVDHAFSFYVEPNLLEPTIVHDYPIEISPFARTTDGDETLTERFEYFAGGMELGNAFSEINDSEEQQARFRTQSEQVEGEQEDPDYVEALSYGMPPTGGLGLGIDRLAMVLTGSETIRDVILFPALRGRD